MLLQTSIPNSVGTRNVYNLDHFMTIEIAGKSVSPRNNQYSGGYQVQMQDPTGDWIEILFIGTKTQCANQVDQLLMECADGGYVYLFDESEQA